MDPQILAALIAASATLFTGVGAVAVVVWQIGKQGRLAVEQSALNARIGLKLDVYRSVAGECEKQQDCINPILVGLAALKWRLPSHFDESEFRYPLGFTAQQVNEWVHKIQVGSADLLILIERWEIIDPRLDLFRTAVNSASYNLRLAYDASCDFFRRVLPPREDQAAWSPNEDEAQQLLAHLPALESASYELSAYLHDLRLEMQNLLLSELFDTRVPIRVPNDPAQLAVRLDQYEQLTQHFRLNTPWGRHFEAVNEEARRSAIATG